MAGNLKLIAEIYTQICFINYTDMSRRQFFYRWKYSLEILQKKWKKLFLELSASVLCWPEPRNFWIVIEETQIHLTQSGMLTINILIKIGKISIFWPFLEWCSSAQIFGLWKLWIHHNYILRPKETVTLPHGKRLIKLKCFELDVT